jgi:hypothetical protein
MLLKAEDYNMKVYINLLRGWMVSQPKFMKEPCE